MTKYPVTPAPVAFYNVMATKMGHNYTGTSLKQVAGISCLDIIKG